jgi:hypothetical protein
MLRVGDLTVIARGSIDSCDGVPPTTQLPILAIESFLPQPPVFFELVALDETTDVPVIWGRRRARPELDAADSEVKIGEVTIGGDWRGVAGRGVGGGAAEKVVSSGGEFMNKASSELPILVSRVSRLTREMAGVRFGSPGLCEFSREGGGAG